MDGRRREATGAPWLDGRERLPWRRRDHAPFSQAEIASHALRPPGERRGAPAQPGHGRSAGPLLQLAADVGADCPQGPPFQRPTARQRGACQPAAAPSAYAPVACPSAEPAGPASSPGARDCRSPAASLASRRSGCSGGGARLHRRGSGCLARRPGAARGLLLVLHHAPAHDRLLGLVPPLNGCLAPAECPRLRAGRARDHRPGSGERCRWSPLFGGARLEQPHEGIELRTLQIGDRPIGEGAILPGHQ